MKPKLYITAFLLLAACGFASADILATGFSSNDETFDKGIQLIGAGVLVALTAIILLVTVTGLWVICANCVEFNKQARRPRRSHKNQLVVAASMAIFLGSCGNPYMMNNLSAQHEPTLERRECTMTNHLMNCAVTFSEYNHPAGGSSNWNAQTWCKYCGQRTNIKR